jgi:ATP-dependent Clp protease ATP-binding subunit ClpC
MSEFQERHTVSKLTGAPPGYIGYDEAGGLTEAVRRRPYRVVLFDEIEKAHPDVFNVLLQMLDDGRLTDSHGRTVDFRNTVIIMTSNLGTAEFMGGKGSIGFQLKRTESSSEHERMKASAEKALKEFFRPEFLNRVDEVIVFEPLSEAELSRIVELMVAEVADRLGERGLALELTPAAREALVKEGYDPVYGARPLRRTVQRRIENALAKRLLQGDFTEGDTVLVNHDGEFRFERQEALALAS